MISSKDFRAFGIPRNDLIVEDLHEAKALSGSAWPGSAPVLRRHNERQVIGSHPWYHLQRFVGDLRRYLNTFAEFGLQEVFKENFGKINFNMFAGRQDSNGKLI